MLGRRAWRYNPETKQMEECVPTPRIPHGSVDDNFLSPVDGSVITSQRKLYDHNIRNGVTQVTAEHEYHWQKAAEKRERFFNGDPDGKKERVAALKESFEKLESGHKPITRRIDDA